MAGTGHVQLPECKADSLDSKEKTETTSEVISPHNVDSGPSHEEHAHVSSGLPLWKPPDNPYGDTGATRETTFLESWVHKGNVANSISGFVMIVGLILKFTTNGSTFSRYVLSLGLFGFAGGITNWLAVKMLFDQIPFLYGSGVIPRRFKEIRQTVKKTIMKTFFDEDYLRTYIHSKVQTFDLEGKICMIMDSPETQKMIDIKLNETMQKPEVIMLMAMMNMQSAMLIPMLKPFIVTMGKDVAPMLKTQLFDDSEFVNTRRIHEEIDQLMETKLELLTAPMVKKLMEEVMRKHLAWLIIWGNIFGALIGLISAILKLP
eukprot:250581_1